jgi:uncharacterized protein (TIGR03435 family)
LIILRKDYTGGNIMCKCASIVFAVAMGSFAITMMPINAQTQEPHKTSQAARPEASTEKQEKPSFEVVALKRVTTKSNRYALEFQPGGRLRVLNTSLRFLVAKAYEIPYMRIFTAGQILSWIDTVNWDIQATPEEGKIPLKNGIVEPHFGNLMIQSLLENKFKLKTHMETRVMSGYELIVTKGGPKLKKAEAPLNKPDMRNGSKPVGFGLTNGDGQLGFNNGSVSMLATALGMQLNCEVVDKTGIKGMYDMTIRWTPSRDRVSIAKSGDATLTEPEISIFDAIQDQLGLKLVQVKVPTPVIVIDDAQMPTGE